MSSLEDHNPSDSDIEQEAKLSAAHTRSSALGGVIGGGLEGGLGGSPISQLKQDQLIAVRYIKKTLKDTNGCLQEVLIMRINSSDTHFSHRLGRPLISLKLLLNQIVNSQIEIEELTRQADVKYGQQYGERPYFQRSGQEANPLDPYTHQQVKKSVEDLCTHL
jgi:hypothetical protein